MTTRVPPVEQVDVVVVGGRIAGNATAIPLARAGRRVLVLERASFPSDTISTHVMFAGGLAELKWLGALERVEAAGAPRCPNVLLSAEGWNVPGTYTPVDGIDYGLNTRRPALDMALVNTSREAGAEIRERCKVLDLVWRGNRVAGVRYADTEGVEHVVLAKIVVGADGRDSLVAAGVGSARYKTLPNGRGLAFHYCRDNGAAAAVHPHRDTIVQWRHGTNNGYFFPNNDNSFTALFICPKGEIANFRRDPEGTWDRMLSGQPEMTARLAGTEKEGRLRSEGETTGFFRVASGPGWALVGDAGSFKDPIIAQGIREGLRTGRLLGEALAAPRVLDDPATVDRATRACERQRDAEVLPTFYWAYKHSRVAVPSAVEMEFYRQAQTDPQLGRDLADTFSRQVSPQVLISVRREVVWTVRALRRPGADRREIVRFVAGELRLDLALVRDKARVKAGLRPKGHARDRWARDEWLPHMALGEHKPSSTPYLPEEQRAAAASRARPARSVRRPRVGAAPTVETDPAVAASA